ncbi:hypothetical protein GCM10008949_23440 [Deinococcus humi]|nr:hypothetical protein GCM10008949_23440 [Deinococcus humi]
MNTSTAGEWAGDLGSLDIPFRAVATQRRAVRETHQMCRAAGCELESVRLAEAVTCGDLGARLFEGQFLQVCVWRRGAVTKCGGRLGCGHDGHCSAALKSISAALVKLIFPI